MSTKNVKNEKNQKSIEQNEVKDEMSLTVIAKTELTAEEKNKFLEAEIAKLQAKLNQEPQDLEERIRYYEEKQKKINQLNNYESTQNELMTHAEILGEASIDDDFDYKYILSVAEDEYSRNTIFKMNNPILIGEVMRFILGKIAEKMEVLKAEIAM